MAFPFGTFAVNILGCLLIGMVFGLSQRHEWLSPELRMFLTVGFCGGFTTFSAFAYENIILLQEKDYLTFALYSVLSFAVCLLVTLAGLVITRG
ncbi:MAG: fluoride efflux transporter CrcB [Acidobacteriota bacterium]